MGSRLEDIPNSGSSHFLQHLAFKVTFYFFFWLLTLLDPLCFQSTANRSHQRLVRDVENIGANTAAIAGRENIIYSGESLRMNAPHLLEIMADSILNSSITVRPRLSFLFLLLVLQKSENILVLPAEH